MESIAGCTGFDPSLLTTMNTLRYSCQLGRLQAFYLCCLFNVYYWWYIGFEFMVQ